MNMEVRDCAIADCDIHQSPREGMKGLFLRWQAHLEMFGPLTRQAYQAGPAFPKGQPDASRRDSWPPEGGRPGSSLSFMQSQLLDEHNITFGVLNMIRPHPGSFQNGFLADAVCQAMEEPEPKSRVLDAISWIGWDRLLFATDYPHWDFDHPDQVLPAGVPEQQRRPGSRLIRTLHVECAPARSRKA